VKKVLIITYYWPPSGGSGVQRWMYFCKYLSEFGIEPVVVTVDPDLASYKFIDKSFLKKVESIKAYKTSTLEPFSVYSKLQVNKSVNDSIPQGFAGESNPSIVQKISRAIRGNLFIPDARIGWNSYAFKQADKLLKSERFDLIITTGPPHSTHLVGKKLKHKHNIKWLADFRDPWSGVYYNKLMYRTIWADNYDIKLEREVLEVADSILTIGPGMKQLLCNLVGPKFHHKIEYIFNGYDEAIFSNITSNLSNDHFVICHLGILSDNQPIDVFLAALKSFLDQNNENIFIPIKLQLIGKISPSILELIRNANMRVELEVVEYVEHSKAIQYMMNANLLFNSLAVMEQDKLLISGKLMEYVASGKPILCLGSEDGDAAKILAETGAGKIFNRSNQEGITNFLTDVYFGKFKRQIVDIEKYSRKSTAKELQKLLERLTKN